MDGEGTTGPCEVAGCACRRFQGKERCSCGHSKDDHRHIYVLLGVGDQQVEDAEGLSWPEIFSFLYSQFEAHPKAAFVGFFLGYDFAMWLRGLPEEKAWLLLTDQGKRRRTMKKGERPYTCPVRLNEDRPGSPDAWEVEWLAGKRLSLRPLVCGCSFAKGPKPHPAKKCPQRRVRYMHVCDAGPLFQTSLLKVVEPKVWPEGEAPCMPEEYAVLEKGKAQRADADLDDGMRAYNRLENEVLARVMRHLDKGFRSIGVRLRPSQWYGPGAAVAEWLEIEHAPRREALEAASTWPVREAAMAAYFGGWFEVFMHGHVPGVVYEYDIASAYPFDMSRVPCLLHGKWRRHHGPVPPALRPGQLRLVHCPAGSVRGSDPYIGAMLHRRPDGSILRPQVTGGWYWSHELDAAKRAGLVDEAPVDVSWTYTPCSCPPPFAGLARLYGHRLEVGKKSPEGKASKLVMNSGYGKMAQTVGSRPFGSLIYAGLITAGCRAMILDAIATHPEGTQAVVMVATDAVFFTSPHPSLPLSKDVLGHWEEVAREGLCVLKPGVYWDDLSRQAIAAGSSPLFKSRGINAKAFAKHLADLDRQCSAMLGELEHRDKMAQYEPSFDFALPTEDDYLGELERVGAGPGAMAAPPPLARRPDGTWRRASASYDWFDGLAKAEQARLRRRWFSKSPLAQSPDEIAERIDLQRWLDLTRRADLARLVASGRSVRSTLAFGGLSPSAVVGTRTNAVNWPSVVYEVPFALVTPKMALHRHRWDLAGKVTSARVVQSANPRSKRAEAYYDEGLGVVRTAPYDKADNLESAPYMPGFMREAFNTEFETDLREDYETPDGPASAIFFGQLGTGQWA